MVNFRKKTIYFQNVNSVNTLYEQPLGYDDIQMKLVDANNLTKHSCDVSTVFKSIHLDEVRYLKKDTIVIKKKT